MKRIIGAVLVLTLVLSTTTALASGGGPGDDTFVPGQELDNTSEVDSGANEPPLHGDPPPTDLGEGLIGPITSIDDIDPNVCNAVHNINACTQEELEELGLGDWLARNKDQIQLATH